MRKSTYSDLKNALVTYQQKCRHPDLRPLRIEGLYDLFPCSPRQDVTSGWPAPWPGGGSAGVYVVVDADLGLVYIGKASMGSSIGRRLSSYFVHDENRSCKIENAEVWKGTPRFVATIPMEDELKFEASALEEYLIAQLDTTDNSAGVSTR